MRDKPIDSCLGPLIWFDVHPDARFPVRSGLVYCDECGVIIVVPGRADVRHKSTHVTFGD